MKTKRILSLMIAVSAMFMTYCGGGASGGGGGKTAVNTVRVWVYRFDQVYTGQGMYIWGDATGELKAWDSGIIPYKAVQTGADKWAGKNIAYYDVPVYTAGKTFNIIFRGPSKVSPASDTATQSPDISGISGDVDEVFFLQQDLTVYATQPYPISKVASAELVNTSTIKVSINVYTGTDMLPAEISVYNESTSSPVAGVAFAQSGKTITLTKAAAFNYTNRFSVSYQNSDISFVPAPDPSKVWAGYSAALLGSEDSLIYDKTEENAITNGNLGANLTGTNSSVFNIWSPIASDITVYIYDKANQNTLVYQESLSKGSDCVWTTEITPAEIAAASLEGYYYQYEVTANGETHRTLDPYAKAMAAFIPPVVGDANYEELAAGKGAIVDLDDPNAGIANLDVKPNFGYSLGGGNQNNMVVYEVHVRDFTIDDSYTTYSDNAIKGTFKGFAEKLGENYKTTGGSYLKDLGITHIQLLPVQNHWRVNETVKTLQDGTEESPNYNWGYDPHSYSALEGHYSTDAADPYKAISEFRQLVKAAHDQGIGVIVDVVYNHTFHNWILDRVAPGCYYRPAGRSAPVGEPAVETRNPMMRKLVVDSLIMLKEQYGVDGVRFDLMGFIDNDTINAVRSELGAEFVMHGEAWNFTDLTEIDDTDPANPVPIIIAPIKGYPAEWPDVSVSMFNDSTRDSFAGNMAGKGFAQGDMTTVKNVRAGIIGNLIPTLYTATDAAVAISDDSYVRTANQPSMMLQYLSAHDGYTLWDKINLSFGSTIANREKIVKLASAMLFTSQGKIFIQGGDEICRTKPLPGKTPALSADPTTDRAHTTTIAVADPDLAGYKYFHENSYQSSDFVNKFRWNRLLDSGNGMYNTVNNIYNYHKGLIAMRKAIPAFRMDTAARIKSNIKLIGSPAPVGGGGTFTSMADVAALTVKFVNGPPSTKIYFAGECHNPAGNPASGPYSLTLNPAGAGSFTFTAEEVNIFATPTNLTPWGNNSDLNIKMVETAGAWDVVKLVGAYSGMGNNRLQPKFMTDLGSGNAEITIDLSITDHAPGEAPGDDYIAFMAKNYTDAAAPVMTYDGFVVIHNSLATAKTVNMSDSSYYTYIDAAGLDALEWDVILDNDEAKTAAVTATPAGFSFSATAITVPARTSIILAHKKP